MVEECQKEGYAFGDKWLEFLDQLNSANELASAVYLFNEAAGPESGL